MLRSKTPVADRLAEMTDAELIESAARGGSASFAELWPEIEHRVTQLERKVNRAGHWLPNSIPAEVGEWIRKSLKGYSRHQVNQIYMDGPNAIMERWIVNATGALSLELCDLNGQVFWRGTFEPLEA